MENEAIKLLMQLLAIPGPTGDERQVADFVTRQLKQQAGVPARWIHRDKANLKGTIGGNCGNVICQLPGTVRGPRRLFMAHLDTVPLCVGAKPVRDRGFIKSANRKTALGADNRAGVAVILNTVMTILKENRPYPPLTLLFTVQEENGMAGARYVDLRALGRPKLGFNYDGNKPGQIIVGATGAIQMQIDLHGIASHAAVRPEEGVSAIGIAARAIADLQRNGWHGQVRKSHHRGTSNVGIIHGGDATNVVTPHVRIQAEARSHDPEFRDRIVGAYRESFVRAADRTTNHAGRSGRVTFRDTLRYHSFALSTDAPVVREAERAIRLLGMRPAPRIVDGGLDANWINRRGIPTVTLGAGLRNIHTVRERLHVDSFLKGCRIALALATASR